MASTKSEATPRDLDKEKDKGGIVGLNDKFVELIDKVSIHQLMYICIFMYYSIYLGIYLFSMYRTYFHMWLMVYYKNKWKDQWYFMCIYTYIGDGEQRRWLNHLIHMHKDPLPKFMFSLISIANWINYRDSSDKLPNLFWQAINETLNCQQYLNKSTVTLLSGTKLGQLWVLYIASVVQAHLLLSSVLLIDLWP